MDKVTSELYNLQTIVDREIRYKIPRYQRLYVWKDEQVRTLFNDILGAAQAGKDIYYIGGVITVKYERIENCQDLVDGQQRFTTLWLLSNELGGSAGEFARSKSHLRLSFSIRRNVEDYFNQLHSKGEVEGSEFDDLIRIGQARKTLQSLINEYLKEEADKNSFIHFLTHKVKMVVTEVPSSTNLSKLFETLNNRGVQLAQHEILKSKLLSKIKNKNKRYRYSKLWNACTDMNNYLERSLTYEMGNARAVANTYNNWEHNWESLEDLLRKNKLEERPFLSLQEILAKNKIVEEENQYPATDFDEFHPNSNDDELESVRSILSFPQLLLHTLRIFNYQSGKADIRRINEKELLLVFSENLFTTKYFDEDDKKKKQEKESISFLNLLFKVREVFDKYVIKWVEVSENEETHLIKKVYRQNQKKGGWSYYLRRIKTREFDGLALLQSILYHSQQNTTQYWLTPFIYRLLSFPGFDTAYRELKKLDNILLSTLQEHRGLPERTWECMGVYPDLQPSSSILSEELSTGFPHYWFYKLEFVLWHERDQLGKTSEWTDYKITAKNSIEHISPQHPRNPADKLCVSCLHRFGNLVLVTRSINSEYSDLPYHVKRAKFEDKKSKGSYDSLKSDLIYERSNWNDKEAINHQIEMIDLLDSYFKKTMQE
ncbi:DUF262 domain-containing protein [Rufibacter immobilis]|uniref:DUF262 domain-containing protein n=1 Tax=Rufibacter immobilis TaxID=1348778 RepID=UPI0035E5D253